MIGRYILVWDPLSVHWEQIRCERVSSFDCLQTYTAGAERELGGKAQQKKLQMNTSLSDQSIIAASTVFIGRKMYRKVKFFPTESSGSSYLDKLPIEVGDDGVTLLCCVHPDRGEDKTTMTHRQITQRRSTVKLWWYCDAWRKLG